MFCVCSGGSRNLQTARLVEKNAIYANVVVVVFLPTSSLFVLNISWILVMIPTVSRLNVFVVLCFVGN